MMTIKLPIFMLALALAAAPAFAQKRKAKGDALETAEAAAANVVKPDDGKGAIAPPDDDLMEERLAANEKKLSKVRKRQIKQMRKILKKNPLYKKKADLLFRIAEKEWDEAKYGYFLTRKQYDKRYDAFLNGTLKKRPEEPTADYSKALVEYQKLLKQFPNYKRIDEVMFYLGRGLIAAGKKTRKQGASYMLRLTREYPKSKYSTKAFLAVAEYYFDRDLLVAAKVNYEKVLQDKKSSQYPYALYKLGYVHYNLQSFDDSIKAFQGVVKMSNGKDKRKIYFTNQAYSALAMSFAEVPDGWKRARDYFRKQGGEELTISQLERIARIYNKHDKTDDEIAVYEYLISAKKQGKKIPEYGGYITAAYKKLENLAQTDKTINRFFDYFDPKGSWYTVNKDNEEAMTRSKQYREEQLDWLIGKYHTKAQEVEKLKDQARADQMYAKAATYYERYLAWFPESKDNYEKEFFLAEIYFFQTKQWDKAAQHYRGVYTRDPKGKYSVESAYAVILAQEEKMADAGLIERPQRANKKGKKRGKAKKAQIEYTKRNKNDTFEPVPKQELHKTENEFLQACTEFLKVYPKNKDVPAVAFRSAEIFIRKGHYAEGIKRLEVIMEHHTKHRFAGFAAATLFDANYRLKRWDQMERWGRYMLDSRNYKVLSKKQLKDIIAVSINEYATELNKKGEKDKAAEQMLRFVKEFPKHEKAPIALFNAAVISEQAEKTEVAVDLYESLIKRYKKSPQATEAHFVLGALYESQTDFERAATYFEKMASFPDVPQLEDALYNAGAIRAALEEYDKAVDIFETYVKKFPSSKDSPKMMLQVAAFHEKQGHWKKGAKVYDRYLKKFGKPYPTTVVEVYLRKAKLFQKEGGKRARRKASRELRLAAKAYKRYTAEQKKDKYAKRNAAEALFLQAEYLRDDYAAVKLKFPMSTLRRALVKKGKLLQKCEKVYFNVLEYKAHDVSAGALFRIGENYQVFAQSLFDLPMPEGLSEDEEIVYRAELDDVAAPLQEKAIEAMQRALELAHKNHVYNEWSARSATLLVKLSPEQFPVLSDKVVNTEWPVAATFSTTYIKDAAGKLEQMIEKKKPAAKPATPSAKGAGAKAAAGKDAAKGAEKKAGDKKAADKKPAGKKGSK